MIFLFFPLGSMNGGRGSGQEKDCSGFHPDETIGRKDRFFDQL
jgi:hypothetical protein